MCVHAHMRACTPAHTPTQVMRALASLAASGQTVVASIHQPRSSIWSMFDDLVLLHEGKVVYSGPAGDTVRMREAAPPQCCSSCCAQALLATAACPPRVPACCDVPAAESSANDATWAGRFWRNRDLHCNLRCILRRQTSHTINYGAFVNDGEKS